MAKAGGAQIQSVFSKLAVLYPDRRTELTFANPWELLIAVILSAQCTDAQVNRTTPALFKRFANPEALAAADPLEVEKLVHSCGFYRMKAKAIQKTSRDLVEKFGGEVPQTLEELETLAGVGRKTASVVLFQAFDVPAIAVDTHVKRVAFRLGWTQHTDPVKIEWELRRLLPESQWGEVNGLLILHGRRLCKARKPQCGLCPVQPECPTGVAS